MHRALLTLAAGALALAAGCSSHQPLKLKADPTSYYASGYCIGSQENVKVFVESMTFLPDQKGLVAVELAIWNERPQGVRFIFENNTLTIGGHKVGNLETQATVCRPGEITRETLRFRTLLLRFDHATLSIDGVELVLGTHLHFDVSMSAQTEEDEEEGGGIEPHVGQGMKSR